MDPDALRKLSESDWAGVKLVPAPTFRLARVRPGAVGVLDAFLEDRPLPERTGYGRVVVAFYREDFVVLRRTLGPFDGLLLAALARGATLGAALGETARSFSGGVPAGEVLAGWFAEWARLGFFASVVSGSGAGKA